MRYPDFLVVGTARAGTTALHRMLRQHPQLFLPSLKEPSFFAFDGDAKEYVRGKFAFVIRSAERYFRLFDAAKEGQVTGEISTPYLYLYQRTIASIRRHLPNPAVLKIVILLRNPVDRAFSQYMWRVRDGREELSFEEAIAAEDQRIRDGYSFDYHYCKRGCYAEQVKAYMDSFPQVCIVWYDDFVKESEATLADLCRFLNVDPEFRFPVMREINNSYTPRFPWISRLLTYEHPLKYRLLNLLPESFRDRWRSRLFRVNSETEQPLRLSDETRKRLVQRFLSDIEKLESLTGRDLSSWKQS